MNFGGGKNTIVLSLSEVRFYSYEKDLSYLHNKYNGRNYYSSRTGLSGAGYLEPKDCENDILLMDTYNVNHRDKNINFSKPGIRTYVPIKAHEGIREEYPMVMVENNKVAFVRPLAEDYLSTKNSFYTLEWKEKELVYYTEYGEKMFFTFLFYNPYNNFKGVNPLEFINLKDYVYNGIDNEDNYSPLHYKNISNLSQVANIKYIGGKFYHLNKLGYLDKKYDEDPHNVVGDVAGGWVGAGGGLFWKRIKNSINVFLELTREELGFDFNCKDKFVHIEYGQEYSVEDFYYSIGVNEIRENLYKKLVTQARKEKAEWLVKSYEIDSLKYIMENNRDLKVSSLDALNVGFCKEGVDRFMEKWNLECELSFGELLGLPNLDNILEVEAFRELIFFKLLTNCPF